MKFGVREICDVVLKAKSEIDFGKLRIKPNMPVIYFDTLKTSSLESATTTVYAQGGRGNPRLVAWEGDKTVTFTMEDALISPESFSILSGAGFMDADTDTPIYVHTTERVEVKEGEIELSKEPAAEKVADMYVMKLKTDGAINMSELPKPVAAEKQKKKMSLADDIGITLTEDDSTVVYVDYYVKAASAGLVKQIDIEAEKFGGYYYLEASTLFRDQATGKDLPAEFIIPNCKVQSNFTFSMSSTGDPSTFTFTMDAFPDYTKFDKTHKVIAAIQIVEDNYRLGNITGTNEEEEEDTDENQFGG